MKNFIQKTFIDKFNDFAEKADTIISNEPNFISQGQLYHYTSLEAIEAMIKFQSIRASSIYLLNDPNELIYGQVNLADEFNSELAVKLKDKYSSQLINNFSAFVFSLSELPDDMNHWEKYGNKHKGIRIGFTPKNLLQYWAKIGDIDVFLVPVVYHDNNSKHLDPYGSAFVEMKNAFVSSINTYDIEQGIEYSELHELRFFCSVLSSMIKRKEWSSEKEWRIICISRGAYHKNIKGSFSNGKSNVYIENQTPDTLKMLTNDGHDGVASKDILKVGCNAGDKDQIAHILSLLYDKKVIMKVSQSEIQTR